MHYRNLEEELLYRREDAYLLEKYHTAVERLLNLRQAGELYEKLKDMGLSLENIDTEKVGNFLTRLLDQIMDFIGGLLG